MKDRSTNLLKIRPEIANIETTDSMSVDERFQNNTLRPILKFQNDLLLTVFKNYVEKHKSTIFGFSSERRLRYLENTIKKDMKFRNIITGILIGQFTLEEYETYVQNASAFNKRIMNMVVERLKDQVQLLKQEPFLL